MKSHRRSSGANEAMFKLIMIGDSGTGKSCLLVRYIKDEFNEEYNVTVGKASSIQVSSLPPKPLRWMRTTESSYKFGTRLDRRVSAPL